MSSKQANVAAVSRFALHDNWISSVAWSPSNENMVATTGYDGQVKIVDLRAKTALHVIKDAMGGQSGDKVFCCDWNGDFVFYGGEGKDLHVISVKNFE